MSLGVYLLLPKVCSIPLVLVVAWSTWLEMLAFQSDLGILLSNIGLAAVLTLPNKGFSMTFKMGFRQGVSYNTEKISTQWYN